MSVDLARGTAAPEAVPQQRDTIAAISTPVGEGAIAVVRVSGENAIAVADKFFRGKDKPSRLPSHLQQLGRLVDQNDEIVDQVLLSVHRSPASYTGEDLVEISCHGGILLTARVLETCLQAGARAARAGEFTERAFLNGKMDLTQAEAVIDLIRARTDLALRSATEQLNGRLGGQIRTLRDEVIAIVAHAEAAIDFSEEGIEPDDESKLRQRVQNVRMAMSKLFETAARGRVFREGLRVVLYGQTNAGKSSLLNRLLGFDRVIVSEHHGTTRDAVEEILNLGGMLIRLIDTAGMRTSADALELQGMERTERSLEVADLSLRVVDGNAEPPPDPSFGSSRGCELFVINKSDLPEHPCWRDTDALRISCVTGEGIEHLREEMIDRISKGNLQAENAIAINSRHRECLLSAIDACDRTLEALAKGLSFEYVVVELRDALNALGQILGAIDVEQILDSVFSQFCIGK
jgi:tRNA modification GTPase